MCNTSQILPYLAQNVELVDVSTQLYRGDEWKLLRQETHDIAMMNNMLLLLFVTLMGTASALFEDQAFKFDWKQSFIGPWF